MFTKNEFKIYKHAAAIFFTLNVYLSWRKRGAKLKISSKLFFSPFEVKLKDINPKSKNIVLIASTC